MSNHQEALQRAEQRRKHFQQLLSANDTYPVATITYHGPDPEQATKIAVGVLPAEDQPPVMRSWTGEDIAEDVEAAREISQFIQEHEVERVLTSEWVLSCPHEPGVDFPADQACPYCPAWQETD
jgi:Lhr-like helicase